MNTLPAIHVISKSQLQAEIIQQILASNDPLILIGEGVYHLPNIQHKKTYVINDDLKARMPSLTISTPVNLIDFQEFVNLTLAHNVISW